MDYSKLLPSPEMRADFEKFKNLTPEERKVFQEERKKRYQNFTPEQQAAYKADAKKSLEAIKDKMLDIKARLEMDDISKAISLSYISKAYFGKTKAWLYQKLNGNMVNGKPAEFTEEERQLFVNALHDLSRRIEKTALNFA